MDKKIIIKELQAAIDNKTKPIGSLGRLEEIALQVGLIQNSTRPFISCPHVVVFAADHGIAATGLVNPYPQEVTGQMVLNFIRGGAAINVFCRLNDIVLKVVDAGVKADLSQFYSDTLIDAKISPGTNDYRLEPAMSGDEAASAIARGKVIVLQIASRQQCNLIGFGEMGIGNTSSASLVMAAILGLPLKNCVGRGTGVNDEQLATKIETLTEVFNFHNLEEASNSPVQLLCKVGGFEIAEMVGAYLQAYQENMIIVVDGFISTAALLLAVRINPLITNNCIYAHTSGEKGHAAMIDYLGGHPVLDLGLRLGEGTGAALSIPLIQAAVRFLDEMASFENAGVTNTSK